MRRGDKLEVLEGFRFPKGFDADSLLAVVPALDWLLPYLDGERTPTLVKDEF